MKRLLAICVSIGLCAQTTPVVSPQEIQRELDADEAEFQKALKIFNPWYTGPLLTPSASMMPVGEGNSQPYFFVTNNYGAFDKDRNSYSFPHSLVQLVVTANIQTGITDYFDLNLNFAGANYRENGHSGGGFGDMSIVAGFLIYKQTPYIPQFKFSVTQVFPTGKYDNLSTNGLNLDGIGLGAFATQCGLTMSKLLFWATQHPINTRLFVGYQRSAAVNLSGFNVYGGGFGTNGKLYPGDAVSADFGCEYSITQKFVFALDIVYVARLGSRFYGTNGTLADGTAATNRVGYNDNLSLSPALEYNFTPKIGLIAGAWFSVWGKRTTNFASGVISLTMTFP